MGGTGGHKGTRRKGTISYRRVQTSPYGGGGDMLSMEGGRSTL